MSKWVGTHLPVELGLHLRCDEVDEGLGREVSVRHGLGRGGQSRWVGGMAFIGDRDTVDGGMGEEVGCASCLAIPMYTAMLWWAPCSRRAPCSMSVYMGVARHGHG